LIDGGVFIVKTLHMQKNMSRETSFCDITD